jgi:putative ATP-binding cassette transporter
MLARGVDDETLRKALELVGLPGLVTRLDEATHWALQLSPGEQQRIAFARALVHNPDWLFLDEATSALDEATEARLYRLVHERLSEATVFSIGHRATLSSFHARRLTVQPNEKGAASIVEMPAAADAGSDRGALMGDKGATTSR